jgi:hypothetical protein
VRSGIGRALAVLLLIALPPGVPAEDYWAYQYKNLDVTAVGTSGYAMNVARTASRLGTALTGILSFRSDARLPTHIYVLPDEQIVQLLGASGNANYTASGYDAAVITSPGRSGDDHYWGVYFGYVGAMVAGDGALRYPYWFRLGVPEVFATTEFGYDRLTTGGIAPGYALTVAGGTLIPMRTFLALKEDDPRLQSAAFAEMYGAESWYLAREILVEGRYRGEFTRYLALLHEGRSESAAFAASFKVSYEDLDKMLLADRSASAHVLIVPSPADHSADPAPPHKLSAGEAQARVALVNLITGRRAEALRLAAAALHDDPANERALRVVAQAQLQDGNYAAALAAVDQLSARGSPSADALAESAAVLAVVASAVSGGQAVLAVDAPALLVRARQDYQSALAANADDLRSWAGLAGLYGSQRDIAAAQALLPAATQALARHPRNVNLAYALAHMCAQTQQWDCAAKFAGVWRENALTESSRAEAAAYESRLEQYRQRLASAPPADSSAPPVRN